MGMRENAITASTPLPGVATAYALGRLGDTSISPMTRPMTGVPPNTLKADQHIRAGRKAKAVSVSTFTRVTT